MKRILYSILGLLFVGSWLSCTEKIDTGNLPYSQRLVVEGMISTETDSSYIQLSTTLPYSSVEAYPNVTDASVSVLDSNTQTKIVFTYDPQKKTYRPIAGFKGDTAHRYILSIVKDSITYTASSYLYPMFQVDTNLIQKYVEAQFPFPPAGYTVIYNYFDARPLTRYTLYSYGFNGKKSDYKDSAFSNQVLFNNSATVRNAPASFEIPLLRLDTGDVVYMTFKSIDEQVNRYFAGLFSQTSGAPGPFKVPPANLPTNLSNGALGYFMATDVVRRHKKIVP